MISIAHIKNNACRRSLTIIVVVLAGPFLCLGFGAIGWWKESKECAKELIMAIVNNWPGGDDDDA